MNAEEQTNQEQLSVEAIVGALEANPELKSALTPQFLNKDTVASFVETEEGLTAIAPKMDQFASRAIETFKTKTMPNIIQEEVAKLNPAETPEQKRIKALEVQMAETERQKKQLEMRGIAQEALTKSGLPTTFASYVVSDSPEATRHKVQELEMGIQEIVSQHVEAKVGSIAAQSAPTGADSASTGGSSKNRTYYDYSVAELSELANTNPAEYRRIRATK